MTTQKKNNKKALVTITSIAALVVLLGVAYVFMRARDSNKPGLQSGPTAEQKKAEGQIESQEKKDYIEGSQATPTNQNSQAQSIDLSATQQGSSVVVISKLYGITSGSCQLTAKNGNSSTTKSADIIYQTEYSTCAGFSIPKDELGNGTWIIDLSVNSNGNTYTKSTNLNVQ